MSDVAGQSRGAETGAAGTVDRPPSAVSEATGLVGIAATVAALAFLFRTEMALEAQVILLLAVLVVAMAL